MSFTGKIKNFLEKLRELPEHQKKVILWIIVAILGAVMISFWVETALKSFGDIAKSVKVPSIELPKPSFNTNTVAETQKGETDNWQTYTNKKYNFEIKYPLDWSVRDYGTGAAISPKNNVTQDGAVNVEFMARGTDYCKIAFADYVKIAGPSEIQGYKSINTINGFALNDNMGMYQITWNYLDSSNVGKISLPITYFEEKPEICGDIEVFLNDNNYSDIYNKIISTFNFIPVK